MSPSMVATDGGDGISHGQIRFGGARLRPVEVPEVFNTDQGCQFTSTEWTGALEDPGVKISIDGKGRQMDNVFIERLWRSLKCEDIYLRDYRNLAELEAGVARCGATSSCASGAPIPSNAPSARPPCEPSTPSSARRKSSSSCACSGSGRASSTSRLHQTRRSTSRPWSPSNRSQRPTRPEPAGPSRQLSSQNPNPPQH